MRRHVPARLSVPVLLLALLAGTGPGIAQPADADAARRAVGQGRILPLARILARVQARHPGQIVEVELEAEDGLWLYEIEVLTPGGRLIEVTLNARTGRILGYEEDDD